MAMIRGKNPTCGDDRLPTGNLAVSTKVAITTANKIRLRIKSLFLILNPRFWPDLLI
jgi:hypothetical protein